MDTVESLIGPEIYSNPIQHVRLKPPEQLAAKVSQTDTMSVGATPWHQDNGVVLPEADETDMLTVWIPLVDATLENGCLEVVPYSHRDGLLQHCPTGKSGPYIPEKLFRRQEAVPIPLTRGGALFMHRLTCHASQTNRSNDIRMSLDLRYNPIGQPTGRDAFPGFVVRSQAHPETELHDPKLWADMWYKARRKLAAENDPVYNRWSPDAFLCA